MTGLRVTFGVLGAAGLTSGLLIGRPALLAPLFILGAVGFVIASGCLAADLLPLRPIYAATSGLALVTEIDLGYFDKLLVAPIHRSSIIFGRLTADLVRGITASALVQIGRAHV